MGAGHNLLAATACGFRGRRCVVIGDAMLDVFESGRAARLAPDAPVPVVTDVRRASSPGGAANVAANLASLGAKTMLLSVVGADGPGDELLGALAGLGVEVGEVVRDPGRATVVKRRVVADGVTLARLDSGDRKPLETATGADLARKAATLAEGAEVVVVSDYSGGVVTQGLADSLGAVGHRCVALDSKDPLRLRWCNLAAATPNHLEAQKALDLAIEADPEKVGAEAVGRALRRRLGARVVAVTLAGEGVAVVGPEGYSHIGGRSVENPDVNGAGDTFLAAFALALGGGAEPVVAASLGIEAATLAVCRPGTVPVKLEDLLPRLPAGTGVEADGTPGGPSLDADLARVRNAGGRVVLVEGCFDLLHRGHLHLLREARRLGDLLVVGLHSDVLARETKGPGRPVVPVEDRAELLRALSCVDHVVTTGEGGPEAMVRRVGPDLYVRGDDEGDRYVEETVADLGVEVVILPLLPGRSASGAIERMKGASANANRDAGDAEVPVGARL